MQKRQLGEICLEGSAHSYSSSPRPYATHQFSNYGWCRHASTGFGNRIGVCQAQAIVEMNLTHHSNFYREKSR